MNFTSQTTTTARAARLAAALLVCASASSAVTAQTATLVGPSIAQANKAMSLAGSNFEPNRAVTVMVTSPSGAEAGFSAVADAEGRLVYEFTPTEDGMYAVRVMGGKGKVLASSNVFSRR